MPPTSPEPRTPQQAGKIAIVRFFSKLLVNANIARINTLALGARLPTIHPFREYLGAGLMAYGAKNTT